MIINYLKKDEKYKKKGKLRDKRRVDSQQRQMNRRDSNNNEI